ncbi:MAG: agmatine deiminase family protein [Salinivirgaceae bacterium]
MRNISIVFVLLFIGLAAFGQDLPQHMTEQEKKLMPVYLERERTPKGITTPPDFPVRAAAEWEEMQGVVISWQSYPSVLTEIVRHSVNEGRVYIVTDYASSAQSTLSSAGVSLDSVVFINEPTNSVWIRDFGPNNVYAYNTDSLLFVDWEYNRPRPSDDVVPAAVAEELGVTLYENTQDPYRIVGTGGNFMSDGFGMGFSSRLLLDESPWHTEQEVKEIFQQFMGIDEYVFMDTLPYDGIHHIDMHMKLLDEETLLVGQYPEGVADGPQIEENLQFVIDNFQSVFGTPFKVVRIPMPADENGNYPDSYYADYLTYTNALILNKLVLVPIYGLTSDEPALDIYREAMPGYNVVGINSSATIPASGAIHCITHELGAYEPLLMSHQALTTDDAANRDYNVTAYLEHKTGIANAQVMYRTGAEEFISLPMTNNQDSSTLWHAQLPVGDQPKSTTVEYYIKASAENGKEQVRPITAPEGFWSFTVDENVNMPPVANAGADQTVAEEEVVTLNASNSTDPNADELTYNWFTDADIVLNNPTEVQTTFEAPQVPADTTIQVYLTVSDGQLTSEMDTVHITILDANGIRQPEKAFSWNLYPNPTTNSVYLAFDNKEPRLVRIVNANGVTLLQEVPKTGHQVFQLNTESFSAGVYMVQVVFEGGVETQRLMIK